MQKWEHLVIEYTHYFYGPYQINLWPPGTVELEWLTRDYGIPINRALVDQVEIRKEQPDVHGKIWASIVRFIGEQGWELVSVDGKMWYFKRPAA